MKRLSLAVALRMIQVIERFISVSPNLEREHSGGGQGTADLSSPSTNLTRGLAARRLFKVPYHKGTIHLKTSTSSLGFEPSPNGTTVSVANHYIGWVPVKAHERLLKIYKVDGLY
ncbi:hypothetical protein TNCV_660981 [Trichonephila clavipes]|nr:hypothetical protein TNCV_660981 [Trichonephila clavipes]